MERIRVSGPWITKKEIEFVAEAAANGWYENANLYQERFEEVFASYLGVRHAIALPSCTSAIHLSLLALGIGPGDEVVVPDITWIASAAPVSYVGATPVFADIDSRTWCMSAESFDSLVTSRTKAVIPVDLYGNMPEMEKIDFVARRNGIAVIEDAAEAIGSEYNTRKAGSFGDTGVFSFHGSKTLTTGEGGMLVTDRGDIWRRALILRDHGRKPGDKMFYNAEIAYKYKMSSMQAALGLAQLRRIEELLLQKRQIYSWYQEELTNLDGVTLNYEANGTKNTYWMVTVVLDERLAMKKKELMQRMDEKGIDCRPFFHPLSSLPAYAEMEQASRARLRNRVSYQISPYGLNLPSALNLTRTKVKYVCDSMKAALESKVRRVSHSFGGNAKGFETQPIVSIGLPVYNGEKFLPQALESLLAQDYEHYELIISDNGSKDGTETICREFQARDARICYVRHAVNRGSPWNFKYVAEKAKGQYFLWAAHDDLWSPLFLGKCVEMLEKHPEVVLCCTEINFIDGAGRPSVHYTNYKNIETIGKSPAGRIHELISRIGWFALYGLMRTEVTRKLTLGLSEYGCDVILLLELLLQGEFAKVAEPLFSIRILIEGKTAADYQKDFQSVERPTTTPYAGIAARLMRTVYQSALSSREKVEVFADFLMTITCENPHWRESVAAEILGPGVKIDDSQFALLLGMVLNASVPLDEIRNNPISAAIYRSALKAPDVLLMARGILGKQEPSAATSSNVKSELFEKAARLVNEGRLEEASDKFDEALQERESSDAWSDWATIQLACGRRDAAERGLRRALQLDARNSAAAAKLGILLANAGRFAEAIHYLEQSIPGVGGAQRAAIDELLSGCREKLAPSLSI